MAVDHRERVGIAVMETMEHITEHWFVDPTFPSQSEKHAFLSLGLSVDHKGRPLHPWIEVLDTEHRQSGKGEFYNWGPNYTVDAVVLTTEEDPRVLLIQREDTGDWALPGGFIDEKERALEAVNRELQEETHVTIYNRWTRCYEGPVADRRTTLHAWPETTAFYSFVDKPQEAKAGSDARAIDWKPLSEVASMQLYGSHSRLIEAALRAADVMSREA